MQSKVEVKEKLIVHIIDEDGNIVETREYRPPTKLEKLAAKLGILKKTHNSVSDSGFNVAAKRWVGITQDPIIWIGARRSGYQTWDFKSCSVSVTGDKAYIRNDIHKWLGGGGYTYVEMGGAYNNNANALVSSITGIDIILEQSNLRLWAEIEYDFNAS